MGLRINYLLIVCCAVILLSTATAISAAGSKNMPSPDCDSEADCMNLDMDKEAYKYLTEDEAAEAEFQGQNNKSGEYSSTEEEKRKKRENEKKKNLLRNIELEHRNRKTPIPISLQTPLERALMYKLSQEGSGELELEVFGMSFFATAPMTFSPYVDAAVPEEYRLGPGDALEIVYWNNINPGSTHEVRVDSRGTVKIPSIGSFPANGVTLKEFEEKLFSFLSKTMGDLEGFVRLVEVRAIQVVVAGEAASPGHYTISGLSTVFNAIYVAGGPSEIGSMRRISLIRDNKTIRVIDFYDFIMKGTKDGDISLESGDVIHFPVISGMVSVSGEVRRPARYEIIKGDRLMDAVSMAGGIKAGSYLKTVRVTRFSENSEQELLDIDLTAVIGNPVHPNNIELKDGDSVEVFPAIQEISNGVSLSGPVKRPGNYELKTGMKVKDLMDAAQGFDGEVYMGRADIFRTNKDETISLVSFELGAAMEGAQEHNIALRAKDEVVVYPPEEAIFIDRTVSIYGEVVRPGIYKKTGGMTLADLVNLAGGLMPQAAGELEVGRITDSKSGDVKIITLDTEAVTGGGESFALEDRDVVTVKKVQKGETSPKLVTIEGEVKYPGKYSLTAGETLSSLVKRAGGATPEAFTRGAIFIRTDLDKINVEQTMMIKDITGTFRDYADTVNKARYSGISKEAGTTSVAGSIPMGALVSGALAETVSRAMLLESGTEPQAPGEAAQGESFSEDKMIPRRIMIDFDKAMEDTDNGEDLVLRDGDVIIIPEKPSTVIVSGAVVSPASFPFMEKQKVEFYLNRAGGHTEDSNPKMTVVVKANGDVYPFKSVKYVQEGDVIIVPWKPVILKQEKDRWDRIQQVMGFTMNMLTSVYMLDQLQNK